MFPSILKSIRLGFSLCKRIRYVLLYKNKDFRPTKLFTGHAQLSVVKGTLSELINSNMGKGKSVPLQAWSAQQGSRNLSFPDFKTTAQKNGKVVSLMHRPPLPQGNASGTHFC